MVVASGHMAASAAAVAGSNMPPLPSNVASRLTNQSLSSYYGAVVAYSSKLSKSRPVSAANYKPSVTGWFVAHTHYHYLHHSYFSLALD